VVALASLLPQTRQGYPIPGLGKEQVPRRRRSQRCRLSSQSIELMAFGPFAPMRRLNVDVLFI
jgi:hypothetical protein